MKTNYILFYCFNVGSNFNFAFQNPVNNVCFESALSSFNISFWVSGFWNVFIFFIELLFTLLFLSDFIKEIHFIVQVENWEIKVCWSWFKGTLIMLNIFLFIFCLVYMPCFIYSKQFSYYFLWTTFMCSSISKSFPSTVIHHS